MKTPSKFTLNSPMSSPMTRALILACVLAVSTSAQAQDDARPASNAKKTHRLLDSLLIPHDSGEPLVWVTAVEPAGNIFPSLIIAQATLKTETGTEDDDAADEPEQLGDPLGLLGVGIVSPGDALPFTLTVSAPDVMEDSRYTGTLTEKGRTYAVAPIIKWRYKELLRSRQTLPVAVTFRLKIADREEVEKVQTASLRTVNDCPFTILQGGEIRDTRWMFAAYVNEDHPWVDVILRDALATGIVTSFTGYQSGSDEDVLKQVYAVWHVLQKRGIRYSDISTQAAVSGSIASQHVRFLDESIIAQQANCVDGSIMFASILRKIGLAPNLILVPGHCYLSFNLDREGAKVVGLETTIIGRAVPSDFAPGSGVQHLSTASTFEDASLQSFNLALSVGAKNLAEHTPKLDDDDDREHLRVSIAEAREVGIRPMPYVPPEAPVLPPAPPAPKP